MKKTAMPLLALCLLLALTGCAREADAAPSKEAAPARLAEVKTGMLESAYRVEAEIAPAAFSRRLSDLLADEWERYNRMSEHQRLISSWASGGCVRPFDSWAEAEEYAGVSLPNPLEDCDWLTFADSSAIPLDAPGLNGQGRHAEVSWRGTPDGRITSAALRSGYLDGGVRVALTISLSGDGGVYSTGCAWAEHITFESETLASQSGLPVLAVTPRRGAGYSSTDAYFVRGGALYQLHIVGQAGQPQKVDETLDKLLSVF